MRRQFMLALGASALAMPFAAFGQQPNKVWRIGFLDAGSMISRTHVVEFIRFGLRDLGYIDGHNLKFEFRWAEGNYEQIGILAADLVHSNVDLIISIGTPCTLAAKKATSKIPIVMVQVGDPIGTGIVNSMARPGTNVTGTSLLSPELMQKRVAAIHDVIPDAKQIAILANPNNRSHDANVEAAAAAAAAFKWKLQKLDAANLDGLKAAIATVKKNRTRAFIVPTDTMFGLNYSALALLAEREHLVSVGDHVYAEEGGMLGVSADRVTVYRRTGYFVDRILRGANPADLPVEQPSKFEFAINLKTARAIGIKVPQSLIVQATKVIE